MNKTGTITDSSGRLLDHLIAAHDLKNDAALSRFLGIKPPMISKMRHGKLPVTAETKLVVYHATKKTGWPLSIEVIEELIAS